MNILRKQRSEDSFSEDLMVLITWEIFLRMLDFVEVFPSTSLDFQATEEKQFRDWKNSLLPHYLEMIVPGKKTSAMRSAMIGVVQL